MGLGMSFKADPNEKNFKGQSAYSILSTIKDDQFKLVIQGLLDKTNVSTKVNKNPEAKQIR